MGSGLTKAGFACAAFLAGATLVGAAQADDVKPQTPGEEYIPPIYYSYEGVRTRVEYDCTKSDTADKNETCIDSLIHNFASYAREKSVLQEQKAVWELFYVTRRFGGYSKSRTMQAAACWTQPRLLADADNTIAQAGIMHGHVTLCKAAFDNINRLLSPPGIGLDPELVEYVSGRLADFAKGVDAVAEIPTVKF